MVTICCFLMFFIPNFIAKILNRPLISSSQKVFQFLSVLGERLLDVESGRGLSEKGINRPTEHFTAIFNAFVMMTLFNEINARKIHGQRNIFSGLLNNILFVIIWFATFVFQVSNFAVYSFCRMPTGFTCSFIIFIGGLIIT